MPYIAKNRRFDLIEGNQLPDTAGELNYVLTKACLDYLASRQESYQVYNDILGALEGCKQELYRRQVSGYEDKKILENGDVYK